MNEFTSRSEFARGYDPKVFRQEVGAVAGLLAEHLENSLDAKGKVLVQRSIEEIAHDLDFDQVVREGHADLAKLVRTILENSNRLHHPGYLGHQVAVPMIGAAVADLINGATNNSMPVYEMGPAASALERKVIGWALGKVGWGPKAAGVMTHGGSMANLTCLLAARANRFPKAWEDGLPANAVVLVPEASHYSNGRAAAIMGLGMNGAIKVPVDEHFRTKPLELERIYREQVEKEKIVMAIVANSCATATGMYDDLKKIGNFCREKGVWFHVDGAHGASALITRKYRHLLDGIELADSVTWDTHKMMATSSLCGMALFRDKKAMLQTFSQEATYIFNNFEKPGEDISVNTLECTKSMLSLKLFFNLALIGERGLANHVETLYDMTKRFHKVISARPGFSCLCEPDANILCFRYGDDSALQDRIRLRLIQEGDYYITRATIHGKSYLRFSVMNAFTEDRHVIDFCERVETLARNLANEGKP